MRTLGLIPARGGSKGIPRKNIKLLAGKPLIAWTIEAALASKMLDAIVVSTDDEEIARVAREFGADVPFMRPAALAGDDSPGIDPVLHALENLPSFDTVLELPPTAPLRTVEDIEGCIGAARAAGAPAVSVTEPWSHPNWMYRVGSNGRLEPLIAGALVPRRQDLPKAYALNGALYYAATDWLKRNRTFITAETIGYVMPRERSVDLDTKLDWELCEFLLNKRK